jgi:hypothetical protein
MREFQDLFRARVVDVSDEHGHKLTEDRLMALAAKDNGERKNGRVLKFLDGAI